MNTINIFNNISGRTKIPIYEKIKVKNEKSNVVKTEIKKIYKYYKCDYCNDEIRLDIKQAERSGGIVTIPKSITKQREIELVLCNKCLNPVLKILDKKFN